MEKDSSIIIDSDVDFVVALAQNPNSLAPAGILEKMKLIKVKHLGFDGKLHQGQIVIRADVAEEVVEFFKLALALKFPIEKVIPISNAKYQWSDEASCDDNNSSGFNYRTISGQPGKLSKHASGLAFDINPVQNIYIRFDQSLKEIFRAPANGVYNINAPGTLTADSPLVLLMKKFGWDWGGDWPATSGRIDYQHFEKII